MKVEVLFVDDSSYTKDEQLQIRLGLKEALGCLKAEDVKSEIRKVECVHCVWRDDPGGAEEGCLFDKLFYFFCGRYSLDAGILFDYGDSKEFLCYETEDGNVETVAKRFNIDSKDVRIVAIP